MAFLTNYSAHLARPRYTKPIDTLPEFVGQQYRWGVIGDSKKYFVDMRDSPLTDFQQLYASVVDESDMGDRIRHLRSNDRRYALLVDVNFERYIAEVEDIFEETAQLRLMRSCFYNHYSVLVFKMHSPFTAYFNEQIRRLVESGIVQNWASKARTPHSQQIAMRFFGVFGRRQQQSDSAVQLDLHTIMGAFLVLAGGHLAGVWCVWCGDNAQCDKGKRIF